MTNYNEPDGHWSNGDPVHFVIFAPGQRRVAPNLNGATWIPGHDDNTEYINGGDLSESEPLHAALQRTYERNKQERSIA